VSTDHRGGSNRHPLQGDPTLLAHEPGRAGERVRRDPGRDPAASSVTLMSWMRIPHAGSAMIVAVRATGLSQRVGISVTNLSLLKTGKTERSAGDRRHFSAP